MIKRKDNKTTGITENDVNEQISNIFFENSSDNTVNTASDNAHASQNRKVPKPIKNRNIAWIILPCFIVVCFIVMIVFTIIIPSGKNNTKHVSEEPPNDIPSVFTDLIDLNTPISEYLGMSDIIYGILSDQSEISANLTLDNLRDADNRISGTSLDFTIDHNAGSNELSSDFSLKYRNANVLSVSTYMNSDGLLFKVPVKSDKLFSVNFDKLSDILKSYFDRYTKDSTLDRSSPYSAGNIGADYIDSIISKNSLAGYAGDFTKLYGGTDIVSLYLYKIKTLYPDDYRNIINGIEASPADSDEYGNFGVTYTISEESLETLVKCVFSATVEDEDLYRFLSPVIISTVGASASKFVTADGGEDLSITIDDVLFDLQSAASAFAAAYNDTLSFTIWRNDKGMLTGVKSDNTVTINNNSVSLVFNTETQNSDNPFDNTKVTLTIGYNDNSFHLTFDRTTSYEPLLSVKNHLTCSVNDANSIDAALEESLDTATGFYECHITVTSPGADDNLSLMCSGKFTDISAGKSFTLDIGNLYINEGFSNLMTLKGSLTADIEKCNIKKLSGKTAELTEMSADELKKLLGQLGE